jgi:membrane protease subunit HflC
MNSRWKTIGITLVVILLTFFLISQICFVVDVQDTAVVTQFGNPIRTIKEPGLNFKIPFMQRVNRFDNRILIYYPSEAEYLTRDKKNISVTSFIIWKIDDPLKFWQTVNTRDNAESRLAVSVSSALGTALGNNDFNALISLNKEEILIDDIVSQVQKISKKIAEDQYGIEILTVAIRRLMYPRQNLESVYKRMTAERQRIAKKYRSEGEEESLKIRARADKEAKIIISEAEKQADILKGEGEAEAIQIYSQAIQKEPDFYKFLRTLDAYRKILDENTTLVLPGDSELMQLLNEGPEKQ